MNIIAGEFTHWEIIQGDLLKNDTDKFRSILNSLVSEKNQFYTEQVVEFFSEKIDYILDTNLIKEELQIDGYKIVWFWELKDLPNWDKVITIKIRWHDKTDTLYLTKDFKIFKTESWRQVFHIGQIVDVIKKRTWEKTWKWTWIIIENWIWSSPVLLVYKQWIMLNTYPQINPFIGEK